MSTPLEQNASKARPLEGLGERIKTARLDLHLTQEALAGPEFTKGYVSALERGAVRPSLKALEVFARRLNRPIAEFLEATPKAVAVQLEIAALEEDLLFQSNYVRMLIRSGSIDEAFQLIRDAEESARPYKEQLSGPRVLYRFPFLRAQAYLREGDPKSAQAELQKALDLVTSPGASGKESASLETNMDTSVGAAEAQVRNMLGVSYYLTEQPQLALEQHVQCLRSVENGTIRDFSLRLSIYRNLANDYWALNDLTQAIGIYRKALPLVEDMNDVERQAGIFWGMATTYKAAGEWVQAKLYATRALYIYESVDDKSTAATISIDLAEILIGEGRQDEGETLLNRAGELIQSTGQNVLRGNLLYDFADLARRRGDLQKAKEYIAESLALLEKCMEGDGEAPESAGAAGKNLNSVRTYADALHIAALISEDSKDSAEADRYFERALRRAEESGFTEIIHNVNLSYGETLARRGEFSRAIEYMRAAALAHPRGQRLGN